MKGQTVANPKGRVKIKLRELIDGLGITQSELSRAAKVPYPTVNDIYRGRRGAVQGLVIAALIEGVEEITGQRYTVSDFMEYVPPES